MRCISYHPRLSRPHSRRCIESRPLPSRHVLIMCMLRIIVICRRSLPDVQDQISTLLVLPMQRICTVGSCAILEGLSRTRIVAARCPHRVTVASLGGGSGFLEEFQVQETAQSPLAFTISHSRDPLNSPDRRPSVFKSLPTGAPRASRNDSGALTRSGSPCSTFPLSGPPIAPSSSFSSTSGTRVHLH